MKPIFTIDSDDEIDEEIISEDEEENSGKSGVSFDFDDGSMHYYSKPKKVTKKVSSEDEESEEYPEGGDNVRSMPRAEERALRAAGKTKNEPAADAMVGMDAETEASYFDSVVDSVDSGPDSHCAMFSQMNLSRPLLRAIELSGYVNATPIQAKVIPLAMTGRDICASAATGSGKTAAFVLPFLERLLYRPKDQATIRVLVVTPTRELATQIYDVLMKLSQFTDVTSCIICGGKKDIKSQEVTLRNRPDVVVCTPGRVIDHLRNSHSVSISDLDVLVLDEVDRLLELGFQEELEELLKHCPENRQTLLFSATMTAKVEDLVKLSLKKPIRVKTESGGISTVAPRLVQEFVKLRNVDEREALLATLVVRSFHVKTICFFETKHEAHRFCALLKLMNIKACELHGDITQVQRYASLQSFRDGKVDVMVCTDVAARGLDIPNVQTVINSEMPRSSSQYIHRVGRTARAGCGGRAITLVSDSRRKVMKEVLKGGEGSSLTSSASAQVLSRTIPPAVVGHFIEKIAEVEGKMSALFAEERANAKFDQAQEEADRAANLLMHEDEIASRPARTWYMTETQKKELKQRSVDNTKGTDGVVAKSADDEDHRPKKLSWKQEQAELLKNMSETERLQHFRDTGDYRLSDDDYAKSANHRMSRVKRRRLEALKGSEEADEQERNKKEKKGKDGGDEEPPAKISAKNRLREIEKIRKEETEDLPINHRNPKQTEKVGRKKDGTRKDNNVLRPRFAVGGLQQDMDHWSGAGGVSSKMAKRYDRQSNELKNFGEFDPNMKLRKGGKKGNAAFKSKAKFKRRK